MEQRTVSAVNRYEMAGNTISTIFVIAIYVRVTMIIEEKWFNENLLLTQRENCFK